MKSKLKPVSKLDELTRSLVEEAAKVRKKAYAPYSKYRVGCVLVDDKGRTYTGCNVENASYPVSICAERTAVSKMVSEGVQKIVRIVLVTSSPEPAFPCGMCLQVIGEFGTDCIITTVDPSLKAYRESPFRDLFPCAFTPEKLTK